MPLGTSGVFRNLCLRDALEDRLWLAAPLDTLWCCMQTCRRQSGTAWFTSITCKNKKSEVVGVFILLFLLVFLMPSSEKADSISFAVDADAASPFLSEFMPCQARRRQDRALANARGDRSAASSVRSVAPKASECFKEWEAKGKRSKHL